MELVEAQSPAASPSVAHETGDAADEVVVVYDEATADRDASKATHGILNSSRSNVVLVGYGELGEALGSRIREAAPDRYHVSYIAKDGDVDGARRSRNGDVIMSFSARFSASRSVDILILCVEPSTAKALLKKYAETINQSQCQCIIFPGHVELDAARIDDNIGRKLVYALQKQSAFSLYRDYSQTATTTCFVKQGHADAATFELCCSFLSDLGLFAQSFYGEVSALSQRAHSRWNAAWLVTACCFVLTLLYAAVRYNVFKGYSWQDKFLVTVVNKAVCWTSLHLFAMCYLPTVLIVLFRRFGRHGRRRECAPEWLARWLDMRKELGLIGFLLLVLHVTLALSGAITDKLEEDSLLAGNVAFVGMCVVALTSMPSIAREMSWQQWVMIQRRVGLLMLVLSTLHVVLMGYRGWTETEAWPGQLPPITITSTVFPMLVILARIVIVVSRLHEF